MFCVLDTFEDESVIVFEGVLNWIQSSITVTSFWFE